MRSAGWDTPWNPVRKYFIGVVRELAPRTPGLRLKRLRTRCQRQNAHNLGLCQVPVFSLEAGVGM